MSKFEFWTIAFRQRTGNQTLLDDEETPFVVIPDSWRYWAADPHLVETKENTYVFAELYDRVKRKGVIGYSKLSGNTSTPWKVVLDQPYHLSYPHILERDGQYYMIPESYMANEIAVFRAVSFPDRWEKTGVLKKEFCAVDSTPFSYQDQNYLMTLEFKDHAEYLDIFQFRNGALKSAGFVAAKDNPNVRPGGKFFVWNGKLVRPSQDCTESYGCALNFQEVLSVDDHRYEERLLRKITPEDIHSNVSYEPKGIHTYNLSSSYEVLDLKGYETDVLYHMTRPVWFVWRRLKRILGRH